MLAFAEESIPTKVVTVIALVLTMVIAVPITKKNVYDIVKFLVVKKLSSRNSISFRGVSVY